MAYNNPLQSQSDASSGWYAYHGIPQGQELADIQYQAMQDAYGSYAYATPESEQWWNQEGAMDRLHDIHEFQDTSEWAENLDLGQIEYLTHNPEQFQDWLSEHFDLGAGYAKTINRPDYGGLHRAYQSRDARLQRSMDMMDFDINKALEAFDIEKGLAIDKFGKEKLEHLLGFAPDHGRLVSDARRAGAQSGLATSGVQRTGLMHGQRSLYDAYAAGQGEAGSRKAQAIKLAGVERDTAQDTARFDHSLRESKIGEDFGAAHSIWEEQQKEDFYDEIVRALGMSSQDKTRAAMQSGGGSSCFHKDSKVTLENGSIKKVSELAYGDKVQAVDKKGNIIYSEVLKDTYFNLKDKSTPFYYTVIKAGDHKLKVTSRHRIFVNGIKKTVRAKNIYPTMEINVIENGAIKSVKVDSIEHKMLKGKYDVYTEEGTVVVDNILCSFYDGPLPHWLAVWGWKMANKFRWFYDLNLGWHHKLYDWLQVEPN